MVTALYQMEEMTLDELFAELLELEGPKYNLAIPDPDAILNFKDYCNRVIWLTSEVGYFWRNFTQKIISWNIEDKGLPIEKRKPIYICVMSPGGSLDHAYSIIDAIQASLTPVYTINMGNAYSAAAMIYLSGDYRIAFPHSSFLIHQGSAEMAGNYEAFIASVEEYKRQIAQLKDHLLDNTLIPEEVIDERLKSEWFINAEDSVKYGMTDKIIETFDEIF